MSPEDFLAQSGWSGAAAVPLAGDASTRRYTRLHRGDKTAILMQDPDGDVALFTRLARHLCGLGLSAPRILSEAPDAGLLLIEDLGDGLIARLAKDAATEQALYATATDALIALHRHAPPPDLPRATPERLAAMTDLAFQHYTQAPDLQPAAEAAFLPILRDHAQPADVMVLRDYHAENILDLPDRIGPARTGLLDFQDAMVGHLAYDLVSLLEDARRDVADTTRESCIVRYLAATGLPAAPFRAAMAALGAQRNLRILGVFARLAATRGKPGYIDLIPRVWGHLQRDLDHPALASLRPILAELPAPDQPHLNRLKTPCPMP